MSDADDEMPPAPTGLKISNPTGGFSVLVLYPSDGRSARALLKRLVK